MKKQLKEEEKKILWLKDYMEGRKHNFACPA